MKWLDDPQINIGQTFSKDHKHERSICNEQPVDAGARRANETINTGLKERCRQRIVSGLVGLMVD